MRSSWWADLKWNSAKTGLKDSESSDFSTLPSIIYQRQGVPFRSDHNALMGAYGHAVWERNQTAE
jgi:hypothetical protein